jgi:hypothetical protein
MNSAKRRWPLTGGFGFFFNSFGIGAATTGSAITDTANNRPNSGRTGKSPGRGDFFLSFTSVNL